MHVTLASARALAGRWGQWLHSALKWPVWSGVSGMCAVLATYLAFLSIQQARQATNDARLAGRPYFLFEKERIQGSPRQLSFEIRNVGSRPAADVEFVTLVADLAPSGPATLMETAVSPNDIGPTAVISSGHEKPLGSTTPLGPQNVLLALSYLDPVANMRFCQLHALYWRGDGHDPVLFHATREAKEKMTRRFTDELRRCSGADGGITSR